VAGFSDTPATPLSFPSLEGLVGHSGYFASGGFLFFGLCLEVSVHLDAGTPYYVVQTVLQSVPSVVNPSRVFYPKWTGFQSPQLDENPR